MSDLLEYLRDRWEWDSAWRDQISLAIIIGAIGLAFAWAESRLARAPS